MIFKWVLLETTFNKETAVHQTFPPNSFFFDFNKYLTEILILYFLIMCRQLHYFKIMVGCNLPECMGYR